MKTASFIFAALLALSTFSFARAEEPLLSGSRQLRSTLGRVVEAKANLPSLFSKPLAETLKEVREVAKKFNAADIDQVRLVASRILGMIDTHTVKNELPFADPFTIARENVEQCLLFFSTGFNKTGVAKKLKATALDAAARTLNDLLRAANKQPQQWALTQSLFISRCVENFAVMTSTMKQVARRRKLILEAVNALHAAGAPEGSTPGRFAETIVAVVSVLDELPAEFVPMAEENLRCAHASHKNQLTFIQCVHQAPGSNQRNFQAFKAEKQAKADTLIRQIERVKSLLTAAKEQAAEEALRCKEPKKGRF